MTVCIPDGYILQAHHVGGYTPHRSRPLSCRRCRSLATSPSFSSGRFIWMQTFSSSACHPQPKLQREVAPTPSGNHSPLLGTYLKGFKPEAATQTITGMQRRTNQEHLNRHAGNHEGLAFAKQKHNAFMPWCSPLCVTFTSRRCCSCGCRLRQHLEHLSGLYLPDLSSLFLLCLCCNTFTQA